MIFNVSLCISAQLGYRSIHLISINFLQIVDLVIAFDKTIIRLNEFKYERSYEYYATVVKLQIQFVTRTRSKSAIGKIVTLFILELRKFLQWRFLVSFESFSWTSVYSMIDKFTVYFFERKFTGKNKFLL